MNDKRVDAAFTAAVQAALTGQVKAILNEDDGGGHLQHRRLAERILALVAYGRDGRLLDHAARLAARLRELQGPGGLFTGGDNVDSPPDSAFSVNDLADALRLLRRDPPGAAEHRLADLLDDLLTAVTPALARGGVHTPNHRWEISAALARLHRLAPDRVLAERVGQWLAEGVDIDDDGLYSERSANYAAYVSNPSLLTIAEVFDRPDLVDAVERNLDATLDLLLPDGSVETVLSRRQDQRQPLPLAPCLLPLRRIALLRGRGDLAWAAGLALSQGVVSPARAATELILDPGIARELPESVLPRSPRRRVFGAAGLLVDHRPATTTVVFGGSDYPRHRRIRSGLANSPTFLRLFAGAAVLGDVRLSRVFFGLGPFRAARLLVEDDQGGTTATLTESVSASYYQPMTDQNRDARGRYGLVDDGRFSSAMDFGLRTRDEVTLTTSVHVAITDTGADLTVDLAGPAVDWALELAFRPGGRMTGAVALDEHAWQLEPGEPAVYRVGDDSITVTVLAMSMAASHAVPGYEPGEEYRFLGGTDAVSGERLYVAGRVPGRLRLGLAAAHDSG
ncbi:hypothetical protein [Nonomuraea turcica]|uniref:hypothetical protein n=1 Tax=Nonomuraea sp. G32 TaxID=3067274 RepID=UPI00273ACC82|nr:hypothetical protein [Nonomuraea sp. G32]MDP4502628.1 hypothetical protein [Nonomuraea sp. G32]